MSGFGALPVIERLVGFDSTSHRSNLDIIDYLRTELVALGAEIRLTYNDDRRKANLYATLGPTDRPGILLSGHTDVVPVAGQVWSSDPFRLTPRDGRYYGRGSADMKSFIGLCLALAPEFVAGGLVTPIHFAFSYDEEMGCIGVHRLIDDLVGLPVKPRLGIIGEPTGMKIVAGHKGKKGVACDVHGLAGHSALARGVNAIEAAAEIVSHIRSMQRRLKREGPFDAAYEPPYTTLHTGLVEGGRALNIVPDHCHFEFEIRALPIDDSEALYQEIVEFSRHQVEPEMKAVDAKSGVAFKVTTDTAGFDLQDDDPAVLFAGGLTGDNRTGRVSFGTEAGLFNRAGIPAVVCGPGFIDQAHKPDEFIAEDQLAKGEIFLRRLMALVCKA